MTLGPRWLYLVAFAAPPVLRIEEFITTLHAEGWNVCVLATPTAATWIDVDALGATTGCLTRTHTLPPLQQESLPRAAAVVAAPITFNSINKWATGVSDTLALGVLNEMLGAEVPIIAVPCVKPVLRRHPAYHQNLERLTNAGVSMMDSDAVTTRSEDGVATFDWQQVLSVLNEHAHSEVDR